MSDQYKDLYAEMIKAKQEYDEARKMQEQMAAQAVQQLQGILSQQLIGSSQYNNLIGMGGIASGSAISGGFNGLGNIGRTVTVKGKSISLSHDEYTRVVELGYEAFEREKKFKEDFNKLVEGEDE